MGFPFIFITPSTRGLSLALTRQLLRSTDLPIFATHRRGTTAENHKNIMTSLDNINGERLTLLPLDLSSESSIEAAAAKLSKKLPKDAYLQTAYFTGGVLYPEKQPADLDAALIEESFKINVISHLLLIKHFSPFLPRSGTSKKGSDELTKWVHISARLGSISDNRSGGWYSYRSSKAALNQVIKSFDTQLYMWKTPGICVGIHPGTVKTDLSKGFWNSVPQEKLFEPEFAAERIVNVVNNLTGRHRGKVWDHAGKEIPW